MTAKRPSGYSEILNPTGEQIADLKLRRESGELARVIFDRTTRGRVRAVWFRRAAKRVIEPVAPEENMDQEITRITKPYLAEANGLVKVALDSKCLQEIGRRPLPGDVLRIGGSRYLFVNDKWMELSRELDYPEWKLAAISKQMAEPVVSAIHGAVAALSDEAFKQPVAVPSVFTSPPAAPSEACWEVPNDEARTDGPDQVMHLMPFGEDTFKSVTGRPPADLSFRGTWEWDALLPSSVEADTDIGDFDGAGPSGPSLPTTLIWAFLAFFWTIIVGVVWKLA